MAGVGVMGTSGVRARARGSGRPGRGGLAQEGWVGPGRAKAWPPDMPTPQTCPPGPVTPSVGADAGHRNAPSPPPREPHMHGVQATPAPAAPQPPACTEHTLSPSSTLPDSEPGPGTLRGGLLTTLCPLGKSPGPGLWGPRRGPRHRGAHTGRPAGTPTELGAPSLGSGPGSSGSSRDDRKLLAGWSRNLAKSPPSTQVGAALWRGCGIWARARACPHMQTHRQAANTLPGPRLATGREEAALGPGRAFSAPPGWRGGAPLGG